MICVFVGLNSGSLVKGQTDVFLFVEEQPPATSESRSVNARVVYVSGAGQVQSYRCENDLILGLAESTLPVEGLMRRLAGLPTASLSGLADATDALAPPSQALSGHLRIAIRRSGGELAVWEGAPGVLPSALRKTVQEAWALAAQAAPVPSASGSVLRADRMSAERRDECRALKFFKPAPLPHERNPALSAALASPFRLIPLPAGARPLAAMAAKGESARAPCLVNDEGYEVACYSVAGPSHTSGP